MGLVTKLVGQLWLPRLLMIFNNSELDGALKITERLKVIISARTVAGGRNWSLVIISFRFACSI